MESDGGAEQTAEVRWAGTTEPRLWHIRAAGHVTPAFFRDASVDPIASDDSVTLAGATLEAEWTLFERVPLMFQLAYAGAAFEETLFDQFSVDTRIRSMQIGAVVGYRLWDAVMPYIRGGLALSWTEIKIGGEGDSMGEWSFAPGYYVVAGVEATLPRRWMRRAFRTDVFTVGVSFEAGYLFLGRFDYDSGSDSDSLVTHYQAALGTVELAGPAMRVGVVVSF